MFADGQRRWATFRVHEGGWQLNGTSERAP
jgi:hypothetical protein